MHVAQRGLEAHYEIAREDVPKLAAALGVKVTRIAAGWRVRGPQAGPRAAREWLEAHDVPGKSYLITESELRLNREGRKTLVTCWNVLMAEELQQFVGGLPNVDVADLNALMLSLVGMPTNPEGATHDGYTRELPEKALAVLREKPYLGSYEAICVDEFQDVAGTPLLIDLLFALAGTGGPEGTRLVLAGDSRQQIMRKRDDYVNAYTIARERIPDLVNVRVRRNCRSVPGLTSAAEAVLGQTIGYTKHRMAKSVPGGLDVVGIENGSETGALASALRDLLKDHAAEDIVVLSPFAAKKSPGSPSRSHGEESGRALAAKAAAGRGAAGEDPLAVDLQVQRARRRCGRADGSQ